MPRVATAFDIFSSSVTILSVLNRSMVRPLILLRMKPSIWSMLSFVGAKMPWSLKVRWLPSTGVAKDVA